MKRLLASLLALALLAAPLAAQDINNPQTDASKLTTGTLPAARLGGLGALSNALGGDVNLNNTANFIDGPSIAQGSTGTWFASGQVNVTDTSLASIFCKLWDGTTTISSASVIAAANTHITLTMSGFIATPAANIRISCRDATTTAGKIQANPGGIVTNGAYVAAFRIQ